MEGWPRKGMYDTPPPILQTMPGCVKNAKEGYLPTSHPTTNPVFLKNKFPNSHSPLTH